MKRLITIRILLFALPIYFGCSSLSSIPQESWMQIKADANKTDEILLKTKDGLNYKLTWESVSVRSDSLFGSGIILSSLEQLPFKGSIAMENIFKIETGQFDIVATITLTIFTGIFVLVLLMIASEGMKSAAATAW